MYDYTKERGVVFTEDGIKLLFKIRDNAQRLLKMAGAFREQEVYGGCSGDSWAMLACVDYLVELGEIRRVTEVCSTVRQQYEPIADQFGVNSFSNCVPRLDSVYVPNRDL